MLFIRIFRQKKYVYSGVFCVLTSLLILQFGCDLNTSAASKVESTRKSAEKQATTQQLSDSHAKSNANSIGSKTGKYQARKNTQGLSLSMKLKKDHFDYASEEPLVVVLLLCNSSKRNLYISRTLVPQDYGVSFEVKNDKGKNLKFIGPKRRLIPQKPTALKQGDCIRCSFDISKLFDIPKSGRFVVRAFYHDNFLNKKASSIRLSSNEITFSKSVITTSPRRN